MFIRDRGVGRPLAWKYSLVELLAAYPVLIVGGFAMMVLLTVWAKNKDAEARLEQAPGLQETPPWLAGESRLNKDVQR